LRAAIAVLLAATCFALGAIHILWAACTTRTGEAVIPAVICGPIFRRSLLPNLFLAAALALAALLVLAQAKLILSALPRLPLAWACGILAVAFLLRAVGDLRYLRFLGTPLGRWDIVLYSPVCLVISIGALWLALSRPRT